LIGKQFRRYIAAWRASTQKDAGKNSLEKEGADNVVGSANHTLSFSVVLGCVGHDIRSTTPCVRKK